MKEENGWKAGEVMETGEDGYYAAHINLQSSGRIHFGAVVTYGKNEEEAVGRRNFILRAIADHIGKNTAMSTAELEKLAESCGLNNMTAACRPGAPIYVGGLWSNLIAFGAAVPSSSRTLLYRLRNDLRVTLGDGEDGTMSDVEMVDAVRALKAGLPPAQEPTDAQADEFIKAFHNSGDPNISYRENIKIALKAALSK